MASTPAIAAALVAVGFAFLVAFPVWAVPSAWRDGVAGPLRRGLQRVAAQWRWFLPGAAVAVFHPIAVNLIEPVMRPWWLGVTGVDFTAWVVAVEGDFVRTFEPYHSAVMDQAVTWFYLAIHHAFVIVLPLFLLASGETRLGRRLVVAIPITYALAQPGFLFLPIDNPSVYYGLDPTPLERAVPGVEAVFYRGTTIDNTLPSMHIGLATLGFLHGRASVNGRVRAFATGYGPLVAFAVLYLEVHWGVDVLGGIVVGALGYAAAKRLLEGRTAQMAPREGSTRTIARSSK